MAAATAVKTVEPQINAEGCTRTSIIRIVK